MKNPSNWLKNALSALRDLDQKERVIQVQILDLLLEVERRKAYAELGYDGLFSFCVKELGYTESQAYQRIQAMHAMRAVPGVKEKIQSGVMNVTTVSQVQVMIRQDQVNAGMTRTAEQKRELFDAFENKTSKQVKEQIAQMRGEGLRMKLLLELDAEAEGLWKQVKARSAHQTRGGDLNCLKLLMKEFLEKSDRKRVDSRAGLAQASRLESRPEFNLESEPEPQPQSRRSISGLTGRKAAGFVQIKRRVLARDQHQCKNCGSQYALQIDHIKPQAKQGGNEASNLRVLCRNCNLHYAVKEFGLTAVRR